MEFRICTASKLLDGLQNQAIVDEEVGDLGPFSRNTWKLETTAENYAGGFYDADHSLRFEKLLAKVPPFDTRLTLVSDAVAGPYTIIDGNHRAVLLLAQDRLIGAKVYLGVHPAISQFDHAGMAYRHGH